MIKICGFSVSNYYNKIKIVLREKGVPFEEEYVGLNKDTPRLAQSPQRKIPFIDVDGRVITESQAIAEYLEDAYPQPPLYPQDAMARAQVRELIEVLELYLELPARTLYKEAFFGGTVSEEVKDSAARELARGVKALAALAKFSPFIAGAAFTHADCAAAVHFPLVSLATRSVLGTDVLEPVAAVKPYLKMLQERASIKLTNEERKEAQTAMAAARAGRPAPG
jgi:glutathione S-transferase